MTRALIYCRISLDLTGEGAGVERQEEACRALCASRGWEVEEVLADNSISAYKDTERPSWEKVKAMMQSGEIDALVAWHIDRITRSMTELETLIKLSERTGVLIATATGDFDLSTDTGRMIARILGAVASQESERKAMRLQLRYQQKRSKGIPHWSNRPFGYNKDRTVNDHEAALIRAGYLHVLAGGTIASVAREWSRNSDRNWHPGNVTPFLCDLRNAGRLTYKGEDVGEGDWEPLVPESQVLAMRKLHREWSAQIGKKGGRRVRYLLSGGLLKCECGENLNRFLKRQENGRTKGVYRCSRGHVMLPIVEADRLLVATAGVILHGMHSVEIRGAGPKADVKVLEAEKRALQDRLDELVDMHMEGTITKAQLQRGTARSQERMEEIDELLTKEAQREAQEHAPKVLEEAGRMWQSLTNDLDSQEGMERMREVLFQMFPSGVLVHRRSYWRQPIKELLEFPDYEGIRPGLMHSK